MKKYKLLVLTDHSTQNKENSLYALLREMLKHPACERIDVASRGTAENLLFFKKMTGRILYGTQVHSTFDFHEDGRDFKKRLHRLALRSYDFVLMRLPYPMPEGFFQYLVEMFPTAIFANSPPGIELTGSKVFLLNFPDICPPMQRCRSMEEIDEFRAQFPIVLKPVRSYGGAGIVKIDGDQVSPAEGDKLTFAEFCEKIKDQPFEYLGVKFLKNVGQGDKRIVVCNGEILGAALRKPASGNWMCNVSQGGSSHPDEADADEKAIVERLVPALRAHGVVMFGVDTLVGDDGRRVLSEINTASIGGIVAIEAFTGRPIARRAAHLLWDYFISKI